MPFSKLWERYFIKEFITVLFLFLFAFYTLYILLDYSSHSSSSHHHHTDLGMGELISHYLSEFSIRLEILLPFAVLIATVKTLCSLNVNNELVAMMASGLSLKRLLRPFLIVALFLVAFMYFNAQFFVPRGMQVVKYMHERKRVEKNKKLENNAVQHLILEDETTLLFQYYDHLENQFFDAYWIRSIDEVYRIKYLSPQKKGEIPTGKYVDHLVRKDKQLVLENSEEEKSFDQMVFNRKRLMETLTMPEELSLKQLYLKMPEDGICNSEKQCRLATVFYHKLAMPWLCLLAFIGPAPFCVNFSRTHRVFFIYAVSTFGLVTVYLTMQAAAVLGERQVLTPAVAIGVPFLSFFLPFLWRYLRIK